MKDISDVTAIVIDNGLFVPIARRLGRDMKKVYYWSPDNRAFPTVKDSIGDGFADIQRADSIWDVKDECDLFVVPDIGFSGIQRELISQGCLVWGARNGDQIEVSRGAFLRALEKTGLEIPKHEIIRGISGLKSYLYDKTDMWIKISKFRGDFETFHWRSWEDDETRLDAISVKFGPLREYVVFYVFSPIITEIEDGCDTWCIDGQFPSMVIHGQEKKDENYIGMFQKLDDLPKGVKEVNKAFSPVLADYHYRSFFSTEIRITDDEKYYFVDATCRAGSPPSQVMTEMIGNYSEVIWGGANGVLVEPNPAALFGVQAQVSVCGNRKEWRSLEVSSELDHWLKCPNSLFVDDRLWFPPDADSESNDIGWLVGIGDTLGKAIEHLQNNVSLLPDGTTCKIYGLVELSKELEQIKELETKGEQQDISSPKEIATIIHS